MDSDDLDSEGWKLKFLNLQTAYEELLASTVDYEEDLNNEIEESQRQEREARNELVQLQAKMTDLNAAFSSQKNQAYQRVDLLEAELRTARNNEREWKAKVRSLEQEKDNLERQQRQLQAEVEDQSERLQNAIEEQEFLRIKIEEGTVEEVLKSRLGLLERELQTKSEECLTYSQRLDEQNHQIEELNSSVDELSKDFLDVKAKNAGRLAWLERENRLIMDKDRLLSEKEKALLQAQNRIVALEKQLEAKEAAHDQTLDAIKLLQISRLNDVRRQTIAAAHLESRRPTVINSLPRSGSSTITGLPRSGSIMSSVTSAPLSSHSPPVVSVNSKVHFFHQLASSISSVAKPKSTPQGHQRSQSSVVPHQANPTHHRTQTAISSATFPLEQASEPVSVVAAPIEVSSLAEKSAEAKDVSSTSTSSLPSTSADPLSSENGEDIFALKEDLWSTHRQLVQLTRNMERLRLRTEVDESRIAQLQASLLEEQARSSAVLQALTLAQASLFEKAAVANEPNELRAENRVLTLRNKVLEAEMSQPRKPQHVQRASIIQPASQDARKEEGQCGVLNTRDASSWKPRYYVVNSQLQILECYVMTNGGAVNRRCGSVNLHGSTILSYPEQMHGQEYCFGITPPFSKRTLVLQSNSQEQREKWIAALSGCVSTKQGSFNSISEGHLELETEGQFVRRYFVLSVNCLYVFDRALERHSLTGFDLSNGAKIRDVPKKLLRTTHALLAFTLQNAHQNFVIKAMTETERHAWISNILAVVAPLEGRIKQIGAPTTVVLAACFVATGKVIYIETSTSATVSSFAGLLQATAEKHKDFLIETTWVAPQAVCFLCRQEFSWKLRKQTCNNCGQNVCQTCSMHSAIVFKGLSKLGPVLSKICDMCHISIFFGQEQLPSDPLSPPLELSLSWHGNCMQPSAQLNDYGVDNRCLVRVHLPPSTQAKAEEVDNKFDEPRRPSWRSTFNSASQSLRLLKTKRATPRPQTPTAGDRSTRELPIAKPRSNDDLWDGIDEVSSSPVSGLPRSPSTLSVSRTPPPPPALIPTSVPVLVPQPVTISEESSPFSEPCVSPLTTSIMKEGFVDQMFGNSLKANWKRRHLALSATSLVFSSVRIPLPKIAKDGSITVTSEGSYLRELGSIALIGQADYKVLSSEGEEYGRTNVFSLVTPGRTYVWSAISAEVRDQWVQGMRQLVM